ncbi:MAG: DUF4959 domain-containing protein [Mangrovibacterium sp.]
MKNQLKLQVVWTKILAGAIVLLVTWQCSEKKDWLDPRDATAPGSVSNVRVTNLNGGAILTYTLPADKDLMGVKAVYSYNGDDVPKETFASAFSDTIVLDGYGDTDEHIVELFAVDESGNLSVPVQTTIRPLTQPIKLIRETLKVQPTFAGVRASWQNPLKKAMNITLFTIDSVGERVLFDRYYSNAVEDGYTFRKFEAREQAFHIELGDRWDNYSVPLDTVLTPLFEEQIKGKNVWQLYGSGDNSAKMRGDVFLPHTQPFSRVCDGILDDTYWYVRPLTFSAWVAGGSTTDLYPQYFTIDMGRKAAYSRLKYYTRDRTPVYSAWVWIEFEVWGTNNPKPVSEVGDGSLPDNLRYWTSWEEIGGIDQWKEGWEKLCDCVIRFPSGTPNTAISVTSAEDIAFVKAGFEFPVDDDMTAESFRYLRFVLKKQNISPTYIQVQELEFFGAYTE